MMISGANNLYNNKQIVDDLNVFPVPDGDTGTNMSLTVKAMAAELEAETIDSIGKTVERMSFSTLRGARGNSGVILSQFFRGISKSLKGKDTCNTQELADALTDGAQAAYRAVMNPTEGTILTVAREAAAGAVKAAKKTDDFRELFEGVVERGNAALKKTTEMLPVLKQAGVVDAGGQGWMFVLEGALAYLNGSPVKSEVKEEAPAKEKQAPQAKVAAENIKFRYCTEFIIERKAGSDVDAFRKAIAPKGDCMLVIDDETIVKVHIHTNHPGFVLEEAIKIGEMINLKIDNMKHQHNNLLNEQEPSAENEKAAPKGKPEAEKKAKASSVKKAEKKANAKQAKKKPEILKPTGFVAICAGKGLSDILKDLGIDRVIEGGQTMNPSTDDILKAIEKTNAQTVYVFPNNKNIIMAATQAKEFSNRDIIVIPTKNIPQCISAMMVYNETKDHEANEKAMLKAIEKVTVSQVTFAVRDTELNGNKIKKGDILGIAGSSIELVGDNPETVCLELAKKTSDEDSEFITVYTGKGMRKQKIDQLQKDLEDAFPDVEISVKKGGQPLYYYIIAVE